jgi:uncharacterized repeat protein (TIGR02543 family)
MNEYQVSFNSAGGSSVETQLIIANQKAISPSSNPTKLGYTFEGWYNENNLWDFDTPITQDIILTAMWTENSITVTFNVNGGENLTFNTLNVSLDQPYGTLPTATKVGHTLIKWETTQNDTGEEISATSIVTNASNHTLYAKWQANTYIITYDTQGGPLLYPPTGSIVYHDYYSNLPSPTWERHSFRKWSKDEEGTLLINNGDYFEGAENFTLYAIWDFEPFIGPAGGWVFYENPDPITAGWQYLEAAPESWYDGTDGAFQWGAQGYEIELSDVAYYQIGIGLSNTLSIIEYHENLGPYPEHYYNYPTDYYQYNDGVVAAKVCDDYSITVGVETYDDWYLPYLLELAEIYKNLNNGVTFKGGFVLEKYWTSTESNSNGAKARDFGDFNYSKDLNKSAKLHIRPIRSFSLEP